MTLGNQKTRLTLWLVRYLWLCGRCNQLAAGKMEEMWHVFIYFESFCLFTNSFDQVFYWLFISDKLSVTTYNHRQS